MIERLKQLLESHGWSQSDNPSKFTKDISIAQQIIINGRPIEQSKHTTSTIEYLGDGLIGDQTIYGVNFGGDDEWNFENFEEIEARYREIYSKYIHM